MPLINNKARSNIWIAYVKQSKYELGYILANGVGE